MVNAGLVELIKRMIGTSSFQYKLYSNNVTPTVATVLSDLTELSGPSGYSVIGQSASDFTLTGVSGNKGYALAPSISWTLGAYPISVYGYFITDAAGTVLLAAARFDDAPIDVTSGAIVTTTPTMGDSSKFAS